MVDIDNTRTQVTDALDKLMTRMGIDESKRQDISGAVERGEEVPDVAISIKVPDAVGALTDVTLALGAALRDALDEIVELKKQVKTLGEF